MSGLSKTFSDREGRLSAVDDISFEVDRGSFFTLVGPSGCGKTTTLRMVAGLETPTAGDITVGENVVFSDSRNISVPTHERSIGMVFQSYAIWPHMTVFDNVAYPLQVQRLRRQEVHQKVKEALAMVDLGGLEDRPAPRLSGGQQQRVALARAMVVQPDVLLLDEPLSNLDASLRMQMREELKQLQARIGITTIYVTHDQDEALSLSDYVAVMNQGKLVQVGDPMSVYSRPQSRFAATFIGSANLLQGRLTGGEMTEVGQIMKVDADIGLMHVVVGDNPPDGPDITVCIRPESIEFVSSDTGEENVFSAQIERAAYLGHHIEYTVCIKDTRLRVSGRPLEYMQVGTNISVRLPRERCVLLKRA